MLLWNVCRWKLLECNCIDSDVRTLGKCKPVIRTNYVEKLRCFRSNFQLRGLQSILGETATKTTWPGTMGDFWRWWRIEAGPGYSLVFSGRISAVYTAFDHTGILNTKARPSRSHFINICFWMLHATRFCWSFLCAKSDFLEVCLNLVKGWYTTVRLVW